MKNKSQKFEIVSKYWELFEVFKERVRHRNKLYSGEEAVKDFLTQSKLDTLNSSVLKIDNMFIEFIDEKLDYRYIFRMNRLFIMESDLFTTMNMSEF